MPKRSAEREQGSQDTASNAGPFLVGTGIEAESRGMIVVVIGTVSEMGYERRAVSGVGSLVGTPGPNDGPGGWVLQDLLDAAAVAKPVES